jgi:hypothetical protein
MYLPFVQACLCVVVLAGAALGDDLKEDLWAAARKGDAKKVEALLSKGADANAKTAYGATPCTLPPTRAMSPWSRCC